MSNDIARAWVSTLRGRGVDVALRGNRLALKPPHAYGQLSDAELLVLRHHRDAIKAVVAAGAVHLPASARAARKLPICRYCGRPCVGPEHAAYRTLHGNDPEEIARRSAEATAVMFRQLGSQSPYL